MTELSKKDILDAQGINEEIRSIANEFEKLNVSIKEVADTSMKLDKQMKTNQKTQEQVKKTTKEVEQNSTKLANATLKVVNVSKSLQREREKEFKQRQKISAQTKENLKLINSEAKSINQLKAQNKALRAERDKLDTTTAKGQKTLQQYNKRLENNANKIVRLGTAQEKQRADIGRYQKALQGLKNSFLKVGAAITGIIAVGRGLTRFITSSVTASNEQEKAERKLLVSLNFRADKQKELIKLAQERQKATTFGDEETIEAQARLASVLGGNIDAVKQLTPLIQDFAIFMGMDLSQAAELVGKSVGSSTNALSRYGIQIEGAVGSSERLDSAVQALSSRFGGQAESLAAVGTGSLEQLKNQFGDIKEIIGEISLELVGTQGELQQVLTDVEDILNALNDTVSETESGQEEAQKWLDVVQGILLPFTKVLDVTKAQLGFLADLVKEEETFAEKIGISNDLLEDRIETMTILAKNAGIAALEQLNELEAIDKEEQATAEEKKKREEEEKKRREKAAKERIAQANKNAEALIELEKIIIENKEDATDRAIGLAEFEYRQRVEKYMDEISDIETRNDLIAQAEIQKNNDIKEINDKARAESLKDEIDSAKQKIEAEKKASQDIIKIFEQQSSEAGIIFQQRLNALKGNLSLGLISEEQYSREVIKLSQEQAQAQIKALRSVLEDDELSKEDRIKILQQLAIAEQSFIDAQLKASEDLKQKRIDDEEEVKKAVLDRINAGVNATNAAFDLYSAVLDRQLERENITAEETAKIKRKQAIADKAGALFNIAINTAQGVSAALATANIPLSILIGILGGLEAAAVLASPIPQFDKGVKKSPDTYIAGEKRPEIRIHDGKAELVTQPTLFTGSPGDEIISGAMTDRMLNHGLMDSMRLNGLTKGAQNEGLTDQKLDKIYGAIKAQKAVDIHVNRRGIYSIVRGQKAKKTRIDKYFN